MSFNNLFGNQSHSRVNVHNDQIKVNLGSKLNSVRDRIHTQKEVPIFDVSNTVIYQPVSTYGASLLDTTSLADLRTQILENSNEEAIRLLADGNNEINFYTGGTGASNLKLQIKDSTIEVKNNAAITCFDLTVDPNRSFLASYVGSYTGLDFNLRRGESVYQQFDANGININENVVFAANKHLKQTVNDSGSRVLFESATGRNQYCLYSYEAGTNSGLLIQANGDVMEINNYKNSNNSYQPISINRSAAGYLVVGDSVNNSGITANFIATGTSVFTSGGSPQLHISATNIQPYKNIIPSGSLDIGSTSSRFNNVYNNISTITNEIRMNTFAPVGSDYKQKGIFFREGYNGTLNGDNMCIRSIARTDPGPPVGVVGDRLMISSYGGLSINYFTNNAGNDGATGRIALFHNEITVHKNILPNADGTLDIGFKDSGVSDKMFSNIYGNNLWAKTSLHAAQIRAYTNGNPIHFQNTSLTFDNNQTISVDRIYSSATNRDLFLGCGASDIKMKFAAGGGGETETLASIVPPGNGQNAIGTSSRKFAQVNSLAITATTQVNTSLISFTDVVNEEVLLNGHFRPATDSNRELGGGSNRWKELFCINTLINTSDRNAKKNIQPITDALKLVRKLKPVSYIRKDGGTRKHTGFISQEVLEVSPWKDQWGAYVDTGNGLGLRYSEFISVNTKAIQELDSKVSRLVSGITGETKVDFSLHTPNEEIIERLEALESKKPLETVVEEYDDSELKQQINQLQIDNHKQESCINDLITENQKLSEENKQIKNKLDLLYEQVQKLLEDKPNVKLQVVEEEPLLSENGLDHMEQIEERLHNVEQKVTKLSNKQTKLVTAVNKLKK